jgi:hypothetical protein
MEYYKTLPLDTTGFVKPVDYVKLTSTIPAKKHGWINIPLTSILSNKGLQFFRSNGIILNNIQQIFKCDSNMSSQIHIDDINTHFGFNILLDGHGEMQWVSDIDGDRVEESTTNISSSVKYPSKWIKWDNVKSCKIDETWSGNSAIVRIDIPHRIVTSNSARYVLALRTLRGTNPKTFDEAVNIFK